MKFRKIDLTNYWLLLILMMFSAATQAATLISEYRFEEPGWNGTAGELKDSSGNNRHGRVVHSPIPQPADTAPARAGSNGTCGYANMVHNGSYAGAFSLEGLPVSTTAGDKTTVSFWMYWDGKNAVMPIGWHQHSLYFYNSHFGFTSWNNDIYGISNAGLSNGWQHVVAVFTNNNQSANKLYLNGVEQSLSYRMGGQYASRAKVQSTLRVGGVTSTGSYRFSGRLDEVKVYNGELSPSEVTALYNQTHDCMVEPVAQWHLDEAGWHGRANEVRNSAADKLHGSSLLQATTDVAKVCRGGVFANNYVEVAHDASLDITDNFTLSAWIKTTKGSGTIVRKMQDASPWKGYHFGMGFGSSGKLSFSNGSWHNSTGASVNDGNWHHVAAVVNAGSLQFYVDGVADGSPMTLAQTTQASGAALRMGYAREGAAPSSRFDGMIDEVQVFNQALSATLIAQGYANQAAGKYWDGSPGLCGGLIARYHLDEPVWSATGGELIDSSGNAHHGYAIGTPLPLSSSKTPPRAGRVGTCGYADMQGSNSGGSAFKITNIPARTTVGQKTTVSFWMYWNGSDSVMPFGWNNYDLYIYAGSFGFHTYGGGIWGMPSSGLANGWHHVVAVFTNQNVRQNQLFIDGVEQVLKDRRSTLYNNSYTDTDSTTVFGGWVSNSSQRFQGDLDELRIYDGGVTPSQVQMLYHETHNCEVEPLAEWHFDESSWDSHSGEVIDDSVNALNGTGFNHATTVAGKVCRAGSFDDSYVEVANDALLQLTERFTLSAWVKTTDDQGALLYKADGETPWAGFYFAMGYHTAGKLSFYSGGGNDSHWYSSSGTAVNDGLWHHVAVSVEGKSLQFYVDGVPDGDPISMQSVTTANDKSLLIGRNRNSSFDFNGLIDEVLIFPTSLSPEEIAAGYANQNAGKTWAGREALCSRLLASYHMDEPLWNGVADELKDSSGNGYHGNVTGNPVPKPAEQTPAVPGWSGTCGYAVMDGSTSGGPAFSVGGVDVSHATANGSKTTVSFWMYWDGTNSVMPFGWDNYDLYLYNGHFGFHTYGGGIYGMSSTDLKNGWHHVVAVFTTQDVYHNQLFIDGEEQVLVKKQNTLYNNSYTDPTSSMLLGGWTSNSSQRFQGYLDEFRLYQGGVTPAEARRLYRETHACGAEVTAQWKLNESSWQGRAGEVLDSSGNDLDGQAWLGAETVDGVVCRGGEFSGNNYLEMADDVSLNLTTNYTISAWIKTTEAKGVILTKAESVSPWRGYHLELGTQVAGKLAFYNGGGDASSWRTNPGPTLNDGQWHHVAVAFNDKQVQFYIDGQPDGGPMTMDGSPTVNAPVSLRIGSSRFNTNGFNGQIDEVIIFDRPLSQHEIAAGYANQLAGNNWDGTQPICSKLLAEYHMEEDLWNGTADELKDSSGNDFHGYMIGTPVMLPGRESPALAGATGTCGYADFEGAISGGSAFSINNMNISHASADKSKTTVSFWMYWDGTNSVMPMGWDQYDLYLYNTHFGFHTYGGGIYGIPSAGLANGWQHVVAVFSTRDVYHNQLFINGVEKQLTKRQNTLYNNAYTDLTSSMLIGGWTTNSSQRFKGYMDEFKVIKGGVTEAQARALYRERHSCKPEPVAEWHLDESNWNGRSNEVLDSSGNAHDGKTYLLADTVDSGQVCRAGQFSDGNYLDVPDDANLRFSDNFTLSAWIKTAKASGSIVSKTSPDGTATGYIFAIGPDNGGKLAFWNGDGVWYVSSGQVVNDNSWHHVAVTVDGKQLRFYVDGVADGEVVTMAGLTPTSSEVLRIGRENNPAVGSRHFSGLLDEVLLFDKTLLPKEMLAGYTHQLNGKQWDGRESLCSRVLAAYHMDEEVWNATPNELKDHSGNGKHGYMTGSPVINVGRDTPARAGKTGTCGYAEMTGSTNGGTAFRVDGVDVSHSTINGRATTVSFWMYWDGTNSVMPFGWDQYDLYLYNGHFGFHTYGGGIYGMSSAGLDEGWQHVVAVFRTQDVYHNQLYINGVEQGLVTKQNTLYNNSYTDPTGSMLLGGWTTNSGQRFKGYLDEFRILKGDVTPEEVQALYRETHACKSEPVAEWHLDEATWNGHSDEVIDDSGNKLDGRAHYLANTVPGKVCRAGSFDNGEYVEFANDALLQLAENYTIAAWIKTTKASGTIVDKSGLSDPWAGYVFAVGPDSGGKLALWNGNGAGSWYVSSGQTVNDGNWHHVAVSVEGKRIQFYVDGLPDGAPLTAAALTTSNSLPLRIGLQSLPSVANRYFSGLIDEVLVFDTHLSHNDIAGGYANQLAGKTWEGTESLCSRLIARYHLDEVDWVGIAGELKDSSGNELHGYATGTPPANSALTSPAISGATGTCGYADMQGAVNGGSAFRVDGMPTPAASTDGAKTTVSFWMYWDGTNAVMPFGWDQYDLYLYNGHFGFHTYGGGIYGTASLGLADGWHHVVAIFSTRDVYHNQLFIDGVEKTLVTKQNTLYNNSYTDQTSSMLFGGWTTNGNQRFKGRLDELRIYNGAVSEADVRRLYRETHACPAVPLAEWHLDELEWNAKTDEVKDSRVHELHGKALKGADTAKGQVCHAGVFNNNYLEMADAAELQFTTNYSLAAWVKTTKASGTIISKTTTASPWQGYVFALGPNSGGKPALWNGAWYVSPGMAVNDGSWHHVAVSVEGKRVQFYVDGQPQGQALQMAALTPTSSASLRIGFEHNTLVNATRYFDGMIDEVLVFDTPLSQNAIATGYTNQLAGKAWDGSVSLCSVLLAGYYLDEFGWNGSSNELEDHSDNNLHGYAVGAPVPFATDETPARAGDNGTCGYSKMRGSTSGGSAFRVNGMPAATATGDRTTVSFWMYWDGTNAVMPFGWDQYDLYLYNTHFGFHTYGGGIYGMSSAGLDNGWHHVVAVFTTQDVYKNQLFIDGVEQSLSVRQNTLYNNSYTDPTASMLFGGWTTNGNQRFRGYLDELRLFQGALNPGHVSRLYNETHQCPIAPLAEWQMDELSWEGNNDEVVDARANQLHGVAVANDSDVSATPITAKLCRGGEFDQNFIEVSDSSKLRFSQAFTIAAWVKTSKAAGTIVAKHGDGSPFAGYAFAIGPDNGGKLAFWNGDGNWYLSNGSALNDGNWHHVAVTVRDTHLQFYVDGVRDGAPLTLSAATTTSTQPLRIGRQYGEPATQTARAFDGVIDELLVFDDALTQRMIARGYANQVAGNNWDGTPNLCTVGVVGYHMEDGAWNGTSNELEDNTGNGRHGQAIGASMPLFSQETPAISGARGTCGYADMPGPTGNGGAFRVSNLPLGTATNAKTTVSFWMYWDGTNAVMPFGWDQYDLYLYNGHFGFHTYGGGIFGIASSGLANGWHHVVAIFSAQNVYSNRLFIDGVEQTLSTRQNSLYNNSYTDPSTHTVIGGWATNSNQRFKGRLDELRIFDGAIYQSQVEQLMRETHMCPPAIHHVRVDHKADGLTCAAQKVTIQACATADVDGVCVPDSGGISGNLYVMNGATTVMTLPFAISSGSSSVELSVPVGSAQTVTYVVSDYAKQPNNAYSCWDGIKADCVQDFGDAGFVLEVADHIAEVEQQAVLTAIQKSATNTCEAALADQTVSVNLRCGYQNPVGGNLPVRLGGVALNASADSAVACSADGRNMNVTFGSDGKALLPLRYADVGRVWLRANYDELDGSNNVLRSFKGSDLFIASPKDFAVTLADDPAPAHIKAGEDYNLKVVVRNDAGDATPNFGQEITAETVKFEVLQTQPPNPKDSADNPIAYNGVHSGALGSFSAGEATAVLNWSEVGELTYTAVLNTDEEGKSGYLTTSEVPQGSVAIGPFVPDHYRLEVTPVCSNFSYSGQLFNMTLIAKNADAYDSAEPIANTVKNLDEALDVNNYLAYNIALSEVNGVAGVLQTTSTVGSTGFSSGEKILANRFSFTTKETVPTDIQLRATDDYGASSSSFEQSMSLRSGRARLFNADGSEYQPLTTSLLLEYWDQGRWQLNAADTCTEITAANLGFVFPAGSSAKPNNLGVATDNQCEAELTISGDAPQYSLSLSAPGAGNRGWSKMTLNLDGSTLGNSNRQCVDGVADIDEMPAAMPWLQYPWRPTSNNPAALMSFGVGRSGKVIYQQEVY